jgi:heptaprenylglyceryl phosphate synthase
MEAAIRKWVAKVDPEQNPLYRELKAQIEETKGTTQTSIMISNSEGLSADQIHHWFPDMEVSWKNNHIHIRWA